MRCERINHVLSVSDVGGVHGNKRKASIEIFYRHMLYAVNSIEHGNATHIIVVLNPSIQGTEQSYLLKLGFSEHKVFFYNYIHIFLLSIDEFLKIQHQEKFSLAIKEYAERVKERELKDKEEGRTGPNDFRVGDTVEFYSAVHYVGKLKSISEKYFEITFDGQTSASYRRDNFTIRRVDVE